jgi:hypothetical protein
MSCFFTFNDTPGLRVYLAAPYSCESDRIRKWRAGMASRVAMEIMLRGHLVYSPISHGHALSTWPEAQCLNYSRIPKNFAFWQAHCLSFLRRWAELLAVLRLHGWQESVGVTAEIAEAQRLGLPVAWLEIDSGEAWYECDD